MVAETNEKTTEVFEAMTGGMTSAIEAGRKAQKSFFKTVGDAYKGGQPRPFFPGAAGNATERFMPVVTKNLETATETFGASFRNALDVFNAGCEAASKLDDGNAYDRSRKVWDAAFGAAKANMELVGKAATTTFDRWTGLCRSMTSETSGKASSKSAK